MYLLSESGLFLFTVSVSHHYSGMPGLSNSESVFNPTFFFKQVKFNLYIYNIKYLFECHNSSNDLSVLFFLFAKVVV